MFLFVIIWSCKIKSITFDRNRTETLIKIIRSSNFALQLIKIFLLFRIIIIFWRPVINGWYIFLINIFKYLIVAYLFIVSIFQIFIAFCFFRLLQIEVLALKLYVFHFIIRITTAKLLEACIVLNTLLGFQK